MIKIPTPHIMAKKDEFADTVLMPGDPKRAQYIADNFLEEVKLVNDVRGILGFTGKYLGKKISVMASGMGMPSMGIYSYELYNFYGVKKIIRVGSAGAIAPNLKLRDIVLGLGACSNSSYVKQYNLRGDFAPICSFELVSRALEESRKLGLNVHIGNILSSDTFYDDNSNLNEWQKMGVLAVEMEAAALYMNAARAGKEALAICTISDIPSTGEECSAIDRQNSFVDMIKIALNMNL